MVLCKGNDKGYTQDGASVPKWPLLKYLLVLVMLEAGIVVHHAAADKYNVYDIQASKRFWMPLMCKRNIA